MNLAAVEDINTIVEQVNAMGAGKLAPELFYTKQLLDMIRLAPDQYVYYKLAEVSPIPNKADKLQLRRWAPLRAHDVPLAEGIPPISDKASMEYYEIPAFQYGRYMEFSDKVDFMMIDPIIAVYTKEYSIVAVETLDLLARNALLAVANPVYAGLVPDFEALTVDSHAAIEDLRLIVLNLKRRLIKPRTGQNYLVVISPEVEFDFVNDPTVQQYMTINQSTYQVFSSSTIPAMFNLTFMTTLAAPMGGEFYKAPAAGQPAIKHLRVYSIDTSTTPATVNYASIPSSNATYYKQEDGYEIDARTGMKASYIPQLETWDLAKYNTDNPTTGNFSEWRELEAHHILIVGKDALIRTGISGEGAARMYVKAKGSAGVLDPIDQRQSIGFKINSVGFGSARLEAVVDYICVPTSAAL